MEAPYFYKQDDPDYWCHLIDRGIKTKGARAPNCAATVDPRSMTLGNNLSIRSNYFFSVLAKKNVLINVTSQNSIGTMSKKTTNPLTEMRSFGVKGVAREGGINPMNHDPITIIPVDNTHIIPRRLG